MSEVMLGRIAAQLQRPATRKFARPLILFSELFTTTSHLSLLTGYLARLGWEVYAIDLYAHQDPARTSLANLIELAGEASRAIGAGAIAIGHGLGGLIALKLAEAPTLRAGVALAPFLPGFASPLCATWRNRLAAWTGRALQPPRGRLLFELVADADTFHRAALIRNLRPGPSRAVFDAIRGAPDLLFGSTANPRLVVAGDSDIFAPYDRIATLANAIGAELATIRGRGHWLIGGRALERAVGETQRFLVKRLGQELLLLYPEETG